MPRPEPQEYASAGLQSFVVSERTDLGIRLAMLNQGGDLMKFIDNIPMPGIDRSPSVSPNKEQVVFLSNRANPQAKHFELWLMDLKSEASRPLLEGRSIKAPEWNGNAGLYFLMEEQGVFSLFSASFNASGLSKPKQVSFFKEHCVSFTRHPDGQLVCAVQSMAGESSLWWAKCDTCPWTQMTHGHQDRTPTWGKEQKLYFSRKTELGDADIYVRLPNGTIKSVRKNPLTDDYAPKITSDGKMCFMTSVLRSKKSGNAVQSVVSFFRINDLGGEIRVLFDRSVHGPRYEIDFLTSGGHEGLFNTSPLLKNALKTHLLEEMIRRQNRKIK